MSTILIIDDQPHLQELFGLEMMYEGHWVVRLGDAESARGYLENSKPDLVLLDLYLNGLEGRDLLHDVKSRYPYLPVLIMTAFESYKNDPRGSQPDGYVVKSSDLSELKLKIKIAMKGKWEIPEKTLPENRNYAGFLPVIREQMQLVLKT